MEPAVFQPSSGFDMRGFNPEAIAYYETEGWRAYYDRNWLRAFGLMLRLSDSQFHIPFPRSFLAVYHIIRASIAFVPREHNLDVVRRHLAQFYRAAADGNTAITASPMVLTSAPCCSAMIAFITSK